MIKIPEEIKIKELKPGEGFSTVKCDACKDASYSDRCYCHECSGRGYIENNKIPEGCTRTYPNCYLEFDPMCGGCFCNVCGWSGIIL